MLSGGVEPLPECTETSNSARPPDDELVLVGHVGSPHGIKGLVHLKSYCETPGDIGNFAMLFSTPSRHQPFQIKSVRETADHLIVAVRGIQSRDEAEALRGTQLWARRRDFPALEPDEYYHSDLVGLRVHDRFGRHVGQVVAVHDYGAGDFLEITLTNQGEAVYFPFTKERVLSVDISLGHLTVDDIGDWQ